MNVFRTKIISRAHLRNGRFVRDSTPLLRWALFYLVVSAASAALPPEKEILLISKKLKPISDQLWKEIVGVRAAEKYDIVKGDTLYDISKRLFGDPKYWPKIWAINNPGIMNPHLIYPGNRIAFLPGSGSTLPQVSLESGTSADQIDDELASEPVRPEEQDAFKHNRSDEWKTLPSQRWESSQIRLPPEVDALGFDNRSKVRTNYIPGFDPVYIISSERLDTIGEILSSNSLRTYLSANDIVVLKSSVELQVGDTYAIVEDPNKIVSSVSGRVGYAYLLLGKVKIIGVRDETLVGKIITNKDFISRGASLIPIPEKFSFLEPVPGPEPLEAAIEIDYRTSTYATGQYKYVFVDRGSEDGIKPGMVFRVFNHKDPITGDETMAANYLAEADVMIYQVAETFSTGIVLSNLSPIYEGAIGVLLTDITALQAVPKPIEKRLDDADVDPLEEFEQLELNEEIGKQEEQELKEIEKGSQEGESEAGSEQADESTQKLDQDATQEQQEPPTSDANLGEELDKFEALGAEEPKPEDSGSDTPPASEVTESEPKELTEEEKAKLDDLLNESETAKNEESTAPPTTSPPPPKEQGKTSSVGPKQKKSPPLKPKPPAPKKPPQPNETDELDIKL